MKRMRGFTLLELLVSMALGTMILLTAATMLGEAGDSYGHVTRGIHAERETRAALGRTTTDLNAALKQPGSLHIGSGGTFGFLTTQPHSAQKMTGRTGDLCAVVYQLKDFESGQNVVRCLTRTVHDSAETYQAIKDQKLEDILSRVDEDAEPLAMGVLQCSFLPKIRGPDGAWEDWKEASKDLPDSVEVMISVANPEESRRWAQARDWDEAWQQGSGKSTSRRMMVSYGHE